MAPRTGSSGKSAMRPQVSSSKSFRVSRIGMLTCGVNVSTLSSYCMQTYYGTSVICRNMDWFAKLKRFQLSQVIQMTFKGWRTVGAISMKSPCSIAVGATIKRLPRLLNGSPKFSSMSKTRSLTYGRHPKVKFYHGGDFWSNLDQLSMSSRLSFLLVQICSRVKGERKPVSLIVSFGLVRTMYCIALIILTLVSHKEPNPDQAIWKVEYSATRSWVWFRRWWRLNWQWLWWCARHRYCW